MSTFLKPEKYWEWRTTIEEMSHGETKAKLTRLTQNLLEKEIEIMRLKAVLHKEEVRTRDLEFIDLKKHYEEFRNRLSEELGVKLENCAIDPYTFEVKDVKEIEKG